MPLHFPKVIFLSLIINSSVTLEEIIALVDELWPTPEGVSPWDYADPFDAQLTWPRDEHF